MATDSYDPQQVLSALSMADALGQLRVSPERVKFNHTTRMIRGGYGEVQQATLSPPQGRDGTTSAIAVKKLRPAGDEEQRFRVYIALIRELRIWSELNHPNIVRIIGFHIDLSKEEAWLISEWQSYGSINLYLAKTQPEMTVRLNLVMDVIRGIVYLHDRRPSVAHGDLKTANILINNLGRAVLCDFGLSRAIDRQSSGLTTTGVIHRGSVRYLSPELLNDNDPMKALESDMWAFGCVTIEIVLRISQGEAPAHLRDFDLPGSSRLVLEGCWAVDPASRLSAQQCLEILSRPAASKVGSDVSEPFSRIRESSAVPALGKEVSSPTVDIPDLGIAETDALALPDHRNIVERPSIETNDSRQLEGASITAKKTTDLMRHKGSTALGDTGFERVSSFHSRSLAGIPDFGQLSPDRYSRKLSNIDAALIDDSAEQPISRDEVDVRSSADQASRALLRNLPDKDSENSIERVCSLLESRYERSKDLSDLDRVIDLKKQLLGLRPDGHLKHANSARGLPNGLSARHRQTLLLDDDNEAIGLNHLLVILNRGEDPSNVVMTRDLSIFLVHRFKRTGDLADLEGALELNSRLLQLRPVGHPNHADAVRQFSVHLARRFERIGDLADLEQALELNRQLLRLRPAGHPDHADAVRQFSVHLAYRFDRIGDMADLEQALELNKELLQLRPLGHPDHADAIRIFSIHLVHRFKWIGDPADLEQALELDNQLLQTRPAGHPDHAGAIQQFSVHLVHRFKRIGDLADLEQALEFDEQVLQLRPAGHPGHADALRQFAAHLTRRFDRIGDLADREQIRELDIQLRQLLSVGGSDHLLSYNTSIRQPTL